MELAVGLVIGSILGLTGAGGAAFALPLLVLLVGLPVQQAIGLSLATVALSAGYGAMRRLNSGDIFWWAVLCLSLGGVIAAPAGKYIATFIPDAWLLTGFTLLCLGIAWHMWQRCMEATGPVIAGPVQPSVPSVGSPLASPSGAETASETPIETPPPSRSPNVRASSTVSPALSTTRDTVSPGLCSAMTPCMSWNVTVSRPSNPTITSPVRSPAAAAGLEGDTA